MNSLDIACAVGQVTQKFPFQPPQHTEHTENNYTVRASSVELLERADRPLQAFIQLHASAHMTVASSRVGWGTHGWEPRHLSCRELLGSTTAGTCRQAGEHTASHTCMRGWVDG